MKFTTLVALCCLALILLFTITIGRSTKNSPTDSKITPENFVGTKRKLRAFLTNTCGFDTDTMDLKCATDMAQTYKDFGFESDILQDRAIYWDNEKTLEKGRYNFETVEALEKFLINICGFGTAQQDIACMDDMESTYYIYGHDSSQLPVRAKYWHDKKKAESDLQTGYSDSTHTDLYLLKYTASLARDTAERSEVRGGLVVLAVLVLVMYTLYRYTKPDAYALPLPNHYELSKTQRRSPLFFKIKNYFHGPKTLDMPLPGAFKCRKQLKYTN